MSSFDPITSTDFDAVLAATEGLVMVDFWAPWCTRCKALDKTLVEWAPEQPVTIFSTDIASDPDLAARHRVMSVPALVFYRDGEKVASVFGEKSEAELSDLIGGLA